MRRILLLVLVASVLLAIPTAASARADKVDVCHLNDLGEWQVNSVKDGRAVQAHLDHGDGLPGDEVPGMAGFEFDNNCEPQPIETMFAVAYTDLIDDGAGYDAAVDVLIAKLIDGPGAAANGLPGVGDLVVTNQYPLQLTGPFTFGTFGVTTHTVTSVTILSPDVVYVTDGTNRFIWQSRGNVEVYLERRSSFDTTGIQDDFGSGTVETVQAELGSPSAPSTAVHISELDNGLDDPFLDVAITLP